MRLDLATTDDIATLKSQMLGRVADLEHLLELIETIADRNEIPRCTICYRHARLARPSMLSYERTCDCAGVELATWRDWNGMSDQARQQQTMERAATQTQTLPPLHQPQRSTVADQVSTTGEAIYVTPEQLSRKKNQDNG